MIQTSLKKILLFDGIDKLNMACKLHVQCTAIYIQCIYKPLPTDSDILFLSYAVLSLFQVQGRAYWLSAHKHVQI